jgi:glycosyltransferase involved in cell wall biosynthesis
MNPPDISVVIPTYQRGSLVCRAVESCLAQSCAVEVIVVDDGSTDGTGDVLERAYPHLVCREEPAQGIVCRDAARPCRYDPAGWDGSGKKTIRYVAQSNQGVCAARNLGLVAATARYVKFLDSDDELMPGALGEELRIAEESGADAVVNAWEERSWVDGREMESKRFRQSCPAMGRGIDDMLQGQSPWTAAVLYRRALVAGLRWNADFGKADDWGWAWTVCLAGARYAMTDCVSAIYWHHEGDRITSARTAFTDSTVVRQRILAMVESALERMNALTESRRQALAQYYYKDRLVICDGSAEAWRRLWQHCAKLAPGFRPVEWHPWVKPFVRICGVFWGVRLYVGLRRVARAVASRLPHSRVTTATVCPANSKARVP